MSDFITPDELARINAILAKQQAFEADPEAWPAFLRAVAAGETPGHVCDRLGINLFALNTWIRADSNTGVYGRRGMLDEALISRSEALKWKLEDQLQAVATFDVRALFTDDDKLKSVSEWPAEIGAAIAGLDVEALFDEVEGAEPGAARQKALIGYLKKFKVWDKLKAIDTLGKHHGMFKDKTSERIADSLESLLAKSFESK